MGKTLVTIKDVAQQAGVSVATVSRALNGHHNVAEPVRKAVLDVANRLHYTPNAAARSLSSRRTQTIGVVLPDLYGEFFSELMRGIDGVARARGMHLLVSSYHGDPVQQRAALRTMTGRVDGVLLLSPYAQDEASIAAPDLPTVLINSYATAGSLPAVNVDNYDGARAMTEHLLAAGHRTIAFIAGPPDNLDACERRRGFTDAMAGAKGAVPQEIAGNFDEASGHRAGQQLLAGPALPDAVFAANDMMALGCLYAFAQAGVGVPAQVALAGFDDIPLARFVHPSLTTMQVSIAALGGRAMSLLLQWIDGGKQPAQSGTTLAPVLVVRDSSPLSATPTISS